MSAETRRDRVVREHRYVGSSKLMLRLQGAVSLISVRVWFSGDLGNRGKVPQVLGTSRRWLSLRLSFHNSEIGAEVREGDKNLD